MVPDLQTSMREIREASDDMVALLSKLKDLLGGEGPVEFTIGGDPIAVPSIPSLVKSYREGQFQELVLRSQAGEVHIKAGNGVLSIVDQDGAPVALEVGKLSYSSIESCTVDSLEAQDCTIDSLEASGATVDSASVEQLSASRLTGTSASVESLRASQLEVSSASIRELTIGSLSVYPQAIQNIFASKVGPYNYAAGNVLFNQAGSNARVVCASTASGWKDLSTMGFAELPEAVADPSNPQEWTRYAPDMVTFQGDTTYDKYEKKYCANCYALSTGEVVRVGQAPTVWAGSATPASFSQILAWPWKSVAKDPTLFPTLASLPNSQDGLIFVHEAPQSDVGRIVYIHTLGNKWKIPRCLTTVYQNDVLVRSEFSQAYEIPPFTCLRLRAMKSSTTLQVSPTTAVTTTLTVLELT